MLLKKVIGKISVTSLFLTELRLSYYHMITTFIVTVLLHFDMSFPTVLLPGYFQTVRF